jgi:hypothetical protein
LREFAQSLLQAAADTATRHPKARQAVFCTMPIAGPDLYRRSARDRATSAICANLPFIAIAKGPEAAPKLSSPRARRLSLTLNLGRSTSSVAARRLPASFTSRSRQKPQTLTIVDDATLHATALDRRRRMFNFCSHGNRDMGRVAQHRWKVRIALRQSHRQETRSVRKCIYRKLLDLEMLVATRGPTFPSHG